jgi:hypothetical protein
MLAFHRWGNADETKSLRIASAPANFFWLTFVAFAALSGAFWWAWVVRFGSVSRSYGAFAYSNSNTLLALPLRAFHLSRLIVSLFFTFLFCLILCAYRRSHP